MESLENGVVGVNEKGEISACSRRAEEMTLVGAPLVQGKRCEEVFPFIPFVRCLQSHQTLPAKAVRVNGVNLSVEVVPVIRQNARIGLFELAHGGILFLDEVEGMSPVLQIRLLRTLQEREVMRVGSNRIIHVDVRIVAATNEALEQKVRDGTFRRDLYYRLNTLPAIIPPLTERGDDIFLLTEQF